MWLRRDERQVEIKYHSYIPYVFTSFSYEALWWNVRERDVFCDYSSESLVLKPYASSVWPLLPSCCSPIDDL